MNSILKKTALTALAALLILPATACDVLDDAFGAEDVAVVMSVEALTGKYIRFSQNDADGGRQVLEFEYGFKSPGVLQACNEFQQFTATDWSVPKENAIHVSFGPEWSEYTFSNQSGSVQDGTLTADYSSRTSYNTTNTGRIRMTSGFTWNTCP